MGTLLFGEDPARLVAALERGRALGTDRFGAVSAAAAPNSDWLDPELSDWLIDHAEQTNPVLHRALHRELLQDAVQDPSVQLANEPLRKEALQALERTLAALSGEGFGPVDVQRLTDKTADADGARMLPRLATVMALLEARSEAAGTTPRHRVLRTAVPVVAAPVGFLDEYPGRVAAATLMRALRHNASSRLAIHYLPDARFERGVAQHFLDAAHHENFGLDEVLLPDVEALVLPEEIAHTPGDLARGLLALEHGLEVLCEDAALFDALLGHAGSASFRAVPGVRSTLLSWALAPLSRRTVGDYLYNHGSPRRFDRRVHVSPPELLPSELPAELRALYHLHRDGDLSADDAQPILNEHQLALEPKLFGQAKLLGVRWPLSRWFRLASSESRQRLSVTPGSGPGVLMMRPFMPSGIKPVLAIGRARGNARSRSVLTQRLSQRLAKLGLLSFAPRVQTQTVLSAENAPRLAIEPAPLPQPPSEQALLLTRVSVSDVVAYARCAYQLYLRKTLRAESVLTPTLSPADFGTAVHDALEGALRPLLQKPLSPPLINQAVDRAARLLREEVDKKRGGARLSAKDQVQLSLWDQRLRRFVQDDLQRLMTLSGVVFDLEREVSVDIEGLQVRGKIDRLDRVGDRYWLRDYKTGRPKSLDSHEALQLSLYAQAFEHPLSVIAFVGVFDSLHLGLIDSEPFLGLTYNALPREQLQRQAGHQTELVRGIQSGRFDPQPVDKAECSRCFVAAFCRFKDRDVEVQDE